MSYFKNEALDMLADINLSDSDFVAKYGTDKPVEASEPDPTPVLPSIDDEVPF